MTSTNTDTVKQSAKAFQRLDIDDQLAALALIYQHVVESVPPEAVGTPSSEVSALVSKVEQLSGEQQLNALRDILPAERTDQDEVALDPNPSKALAELAKGGTSVPTGEYGSLSAESKLAFWYQIGQKLGKNITGVPAGYSPSPEVTEFLSSLRSLDVDQRMSFLTQVL